MPLQCVCLPVSCRNHLNPLFLAASLLILHLIGPSQSILARAVGLIRKVIKALTAVRPSWFSLKHKQKLTSKIPMLTPALSLLFLYQLICKYPGQFYFGITESPGKMCSAVRLNLIVTRIPWLVSCLLASWQTKTHSNLIVYHFVDRRVNMLHLWFLRKTELA